MQFSSEGFDLDALVASEGNLQQNKSNNGCTGDVIYEIGGGVTHITPPAAASAPAAPTEVNKKGDSKSTKDVQDNNDDGGDEDNVMKEADVFKEQGNAAFMDKNWKEAYDLYTAAIHATPGSLKGEDLLRMREEHYVKLQKLARQRLQQQEEQRREKAKREKEKRQQQASGEKKEKEEDNDDNKNDDDDDKDDEQPTSQSDKEEKDSPEEFQAPTQPHGEKLSIFYCNRSACLMQLERYTEALDDVDVALLLNPNYVKAFVRRCKVHERLDHVDLALKDAKQALQREPDNAQFRKQVKRLEKLEAERMEKLKAETMDKLKELGNSILGNFGLSLDNFKAVQDPKTGSYSISFEQNAKK